MHCYKHSTFDLDYYGAAGNSMIVQMQGLEHTVFIRVNQAE